MGEKIKVMFFGTHPCCYNGYCLITYNLGKQLAARGDIELIVFGFQNFYMSPPHIKERELPPNVYIYDAFFNENPKQMGFGFDQVKEVVKMVKPDVCVVYNDMVVVSNVMNKLKEAKEEDGMGFKTIVYIDQVYLYQKAEYIKLLNERADYVLCFTPYWEGIAKGIGITRPMGYLQHGFDPMVHYPVPKALARQYFGLKKDDFIIMNLNRNQPRKRWDICLQAFAEVVSRHLEEPIKLLIATAVNGAWNLMEVYERELKKRGLTLEQGMKHIVLIDNPQQLTDEDVNILYNVANVGINTCDGEGFGLCNFQQAAIGIPQIVPAIGGFLDFFGGGRACCIEPKFTLYIDTGRDGVGGESQLCEWIDFANAIDQLYSNPEDAERMGQEARRFICKNYSWESIGDKFYNILKEVNGLPSKAAEIREAISSAQAPKPPPSGNVPLSLVQQWEKELGAVKEALPSPTAPPAVSSQEAPKNLTDAKEDPDDDIQYVPVRRREVKKTPQSALLQKKEETKSRLREKLEKKKAEEAAIDKGIDTDLDKESLLALKAKIDRLLGEDKPASKAKPKRK